MKKIIFGVVLIIVVVIGAIWYIGHKSGSPLMTKSTTQPTPTPKPTAVPINEVDPAKLPDKFPTDVPIESGATITMNFNATNSKGEYQASREFVSKKSADVNFQYYQTVLKKNGWNVTSTIDDTARSQKIILATKGTNDLNIRIYTDNGQEKVSINNIVK